MRLFLRRRSRTLLCGDLFSQPGHEVPRSAPPRLPSGSRARRFADRFPYYASLRDPKALTEKLAANEPELLACMHGSSYRGDGATLLRRLGEALAA